MRSYIKFNYEARLQLDTDINKGVLYSVRLYIRDCVRSQVSNQVVDQVWFQAWIQTRGETNEGS